MYGVLNLCYDVHCTGYGVPACQGHHTQGSEDKKRVSGKWGKLSSLTLAYSASPETAVKEAGQPIMFCLNFAVPLFDLSVHLHLM